MAEDSTDGIEVASPEGDKFVFVDRKAAIDYAVIERAKWNWLSQQNPGREFGGALSPLLQFIGGLDAVLGEASSVKSAASDEAIANGLRNYVSWTPAIHDRSPLQAYLLRVAERSDKEAMWTLGWLAFRYDRIRRLDVHLNSYWNTPGYLTGMTSAWIWDERALSAKATENVLERTQGIAAQAQSFRDQTQSAFNTARDTTAAINGLADSGRSTMSASNERLDTFVNALDGRLNEVVSSRDADLEKKWRELTTTYEESLKLKAPAKYWGLKQATHKRLATRFAWASAGFALVIGAVMCGAFYALMSNVPAGSYVPPWRDVLPSVVLAVVFLWALRTLVRLTMSHVHLSLDAEERRVMVQCYLAMTHKGETTGDERGALFAAIFRPTGDGLVKDEAPPIPMWEMLKATKTKPD